MLSFSRKVKEEIVYNDFDDCCEKALIAALIKMNGSLTLNNTGLVLVIRTENAKIASKCHKIFKDLYQPTIEFKVSKKMKLKKNNIYEVRVTKAKEILDDLGLLLGFGLTDVPQGDITKKECCKRAFLAGAFLGGGSVNAPTKSNYHLEISCEKEEFASFIQYLMNKFELNAKIIDRRGKSIVYIKSAEKISDFLRIVGAQSSYFEYEEVRIDRDFMNSINRVENCYIANSEKSISAATKQINDIQLIDQYLGLAFLDEKTERIARIRLANPDLSLKELADSYSAAYGETISKSGLHHQFAKIAQVAERLKEPNE